MTTHLTTLYTFSHCAAIINCRFYPSIPGQEMKTRETSQTLKEIIMRHHRHTSDRKNFSVLQRFGISKLALLLFLGIGLLILLTGLFRAQPVRAAIGACTSPSDCLSKMTLDEKIGQMTQANKNALTQTGNSTSDIATYFLGSLLSGGGEGPNSPSSGGTASQWADMYDNYQNIATQTRLGIPLIYGVDAVHGHNNVSGSVIFPHNIGMGATRNAALVQQEEAVTRDEVLGTGMNWVFAPCVCVPRDDRWGRSYEGFGEDTALVQSMTSAAVQGFQGSGLSTTTVMATAKHYVGDGGTTYGTGSSGYLIDQGNTQIDEATLRAIHLPPYQTAIANNVGSVMISYSSWNGVKMHGNQYLITTVLKGELGFSGIVVSDWAGIDAISGDYPTAVRTAINAGIDMVMVPSNYKTFISTLRNEVNAGRVPMSRIDDAVLRILTKKFALGLFSKFHTDRSYTSQVGSSAHRAVARQAVRESQVLLKNDGVLPLSKTSTYKIVVGGSHVDNLGYQMGGWAITWQGGSGNTTTGTTFWQAIQAAKPANVTLQNVGTNTASSYTGDIGIAVIGETPYAEGQGDSSSLALNSTNATQVSDICSRVTKCIVILMSGRPLIVNTQVNLANAFVAAWLPGTEGAGMTDVLFGDFNFTGKLPVSWPNAVSQEPINNGDGKVGLFPFGYGLSYGSNPTATPTRTFTPTIPPVITNTPTNPVITNTPTRTNTPVTPVITNTPTRTNTPGTPVITNTPTRTFTPTIPLVITNTPTRTFTPTTPPVVTNTPTQPTGGACTPVTSTITIPFTFDGAGTFCWQAASLGGFINSWNTVSVSVNGMNVTNIWVGSGSYPAKINNNYYVSYNSTVAWGHFEAKP
jgi:beta-glucosidase